MSFALTSAAPQLNAQNFASLALGALNSLQTPGQSPLSAITGLLDKIALNPQPLPPKALGLNQLLDPSAALAINPQPLPPGGGEHGGFSSLADDWCGTVPHVLPHFPPNPPGPWADLVNSALSFR